MRFNNTVPYLWVMVSISLTACGSSAQNQSATSGGGCPAANSSCTTSTGPNPIPTSGTSTVPLYVADASTTGRYGYPNEPMVSVTICTPNHTSASQCQTISNILLDTGSFGLRVFGSAINSNVHLAQQTITVQGETMNLAECAAFGTGADWGSVKNADVLLGNQTATNIPIHVIDIGFGQIPDGCAALCPDTDPCMASFNGILGVGPFTQDCGTNCDSSDDSVNPGAYFGCDSTGCYDGYSGNCGSDGVCAVQVSTTQQVVNPVGQFASGHNNGVSLTLPSISANGSSAVTSGTLTLGIGATSSVQVYPADPNGMNDYNNLDFDTTFDGTLLGYQGTDGSLAFLDSGSNGIFFPANLPSCSDSQGFFCPGSTQDFNATMAGYQGTASNSESFYIGNADSLFGSGNSAFNNIGGPASGMFDWGLPFFFGHTIYVGLSGTTANINSSSVTGPYWAF